MLLEYGGAIVVAAILYFALVNWLRSGVNNVWTAHQLDQATLRGLWIVPLLGGVLLILFYGARFVWWQLQG